MREEEAKQAILHLPTEEEVGTQWFRAVADGNEAKVAELLVAHPAIIDNQTVTALLLAAGQGHDKIVELLLAAKGSADATDFDGCTALHYAVKRTSDIPGPVLRVVKLLLAARPTLLDVVDGEGCTALLCAVKQKKKVIVNQLLLSLAANHNLKSLDVKDSSGLNVLHYAIQQENEALVWRLLELQPELIHRASANGYTPLHMAIQWSSHYTSSPLNHMASRLFQLCPQVATDYDKEYLLRLAVENDCEADLDLHVPQSTFDQVVAAFRAMTDNKSPQGRLRPLIDAQCGSLSMVLNQDVMSIVYEYLFFTQQECNERGEETEERNQRWFVAVAHGDKELVTRMLSEDPSLLEVRGEYGDTALHLAAKMGHSSIVELLLAASPTLGLLGNNQGVTALMFAAGRDHDRVAEMLLAACPESLDLVDRNHCTALLHARKKTVSTILAANPKNFTATDAWGYTALYPALRVDRVERFTRVEKLLEVDPSFHAIQHVKRVEHVEKLLELDPNLVCNLTRRLQTPLWFAVEQGANNLIKRLFDMFPQALHMAADNGMTPYDLAARDKNDFAVDFFMPKLTFEENAREFRKFPAIFEGYGERLRSVIDMQCEGVAKELNPTLLSTICSYLGFGTLVVF